jgi:Zn-dependent peptidase ImmA (M78 family)
MRWISDGTKRFGRRPFYEAQEMDAEAADLFSAFLLDKCGVVAYPISTDDLTVLLERHADLDLYANLKEHGDDVEGMTTFSARCRPFVQIDERLTTDSRRANRLRTTLAHELGHVRLHNILFQNLIGAVPLFGDGPAAEQHCRREGIRHATATDWMEYQAFYLGGELLAPKRKIIELARKIVGSSVAIAPGSDGERRCAIAVAKAFHLSLEAARVRLLISGIVSQQSGGTLLGG